MTVRPFIQQDEVHTMTDTLAQAAPGMTTDGATASETAAAAELVERFLTASIVSDPETAATFMAPDVEITFTGGRSFKHLRETSGFNAQRYAWVKKKMDRFDVRDGRITTMDVWNDSAERILTARGTDA